MTRRLRRVKSAEEESTDDASPSFTRDSDEDAVRRAIRAALEAKVVKTKCPAVLRLVFHDAGTYLESAKDGGMSASVRYELNRPESFGLKRGLNVVKSAYDALDGTAAEGKVSFADMISCAGAYAVGLPEDRRSWSECRSAESALTRLIQKIECRSRR